MVLQQRILAAGEQCGALCVAGASILDGFEKLRGRRLEVCKELFSVFQLIHEMSRLPSCASESKKNITLKLQKLFAGLFFAVLVLATLAVADAATPPDQGPGGPILVVTSSANPFSTYYAEILRAEGLNSFAVTDISSVSGVTLASYDVVLLGEMPLSTVQVTMFSDYVTSGGNLIAMRPDKQLAALLGLTATASTLSDRYLLVDSSAGPGVGIVNQTIQFHGTADLYTLSGASSLATLYSDSATAMTNPAVTWQNIGTNGGHVAAFTFDLARSIVYTRQGNPAWSGQERDGITPIRSDDLFFGAASFDPKADWVDLTKVQIPQADEQQRLLANLILLMNLDRKPLPRFWYFPNGKKAVVVMTSDSHASNGITGRLDSYKANSSIGCSVVDWECIRASAYISSGTVLSNSQAAGYIADGFDIGWHINTSCADWTSQSQLDTSYYIPQLSAFATNFPSVPGPTTNRTHCVVWSDYSSQPQVELNHGIRLDTTYYYYPGTWLKDQPGLFTGSGMPMRFATTNGTMIDVYQATTQMSDEAGQSYPFTIDTLLDNAIGPAGYYGAFTANVHSDASGGSSAESDAIVASAQARGVSIVSAKQMLTWLDGRNSSSFGSLAWNGNVLSFNIDVRVGANGLQVMLPTTSSAGPITSVTLNGTPVSYTNQTIKGVEYAIFSATAGAYQVTYNIDTTPPVTTITANPPPLTNSTNASFSFTSSKPLSSFSCSLDGSSFAACESPWNLSNLTIATHTFQIQATDTGGRTGAPTAFVWTINTSQTVVFTDTTFADFSAGTLDPNTHISQTADGEIILAPTAGAEFLGTGLPAGWYSSPWVTGGSASVGNGLATVDGTLIGTNALYPYESGRSLEFVATFSGAPYQNVGFGWNLLGAPWAMFGTGSAGGNLYARTAKGTTLIDTPITANVLGSAHRYRIDWNASNIVFSIDGNIVATHAVSFSGGYSMGPVASTYNAGTGAVSVDWMRMSPYAASGTFLSRVFDAAATVNWGGVSWTSNTPAGTMVEISVRLGNTPVPDGTWTAFTPIANSGGAISGASRYFQYRAVLTTTVADQTPTLNDITFAGLNPPSITSLSPNSGYVGTSVTIAGTNFDSTQGTSTVSFNGTPAISITSWSATSIVAPVPSGATTGDVVVTVGGLASNGSAFTVTAPDTTPDPFSFTPQTGVALNTTVTSSTITVSGIDTAAPISITGGSYSVNGAAYATVSGTVNNGDTVAVQLTSSGSYNSQTCSTLTIGGVSGQFCATTLLDTAAPGAPSLLGANPSGWTNANSFTLSWTNSSDLSGIVAAWYKVGSVPTTAGDGIRVAGSNIQSIPGVQARAEGGQTVYVWLEDGQGNKDQNSRASTILQYDATAPASGTIAINNGAANTSSPIVALNSLGATETMSGLSQMRFSNDNLTWSAWESYATTKSNWDLSQFGGNTSFGTKIVYVQYGDGAGNPSVSFNGTISYADAQGPNVAITSHINNQTVTSSPIAVSGTASDSGLGNSGISSVTVNGVVATGGTTSGSGTANWSRSVTLSGGANTITVVAKDNSASQNATTVSITVNYTPAAPMANPAINVTSSDFMANWSSAIGATGYRLDVSTSSTFSSYVSGYQDLDVGNVLSRSVTGLNAGTTYYYQVRAYNVGGASGNSNTISVTTTATVAAITPDTIDVVTPPAGFTITGGGFVNSGFGWSVVNFMRNGQLLAQARASSGTVANISVPFPGTTNIFGGAVPGLSAGPVTVQVYNQTGANSWSFIGGTSLTVSPPAVSAITPNPTELAFPPASLTITGGGFVNSGFGWSVVNFMRNGQLLAQARASSGTGTSLSVPFPGTTNIFGGAVPGLSAGPVTVQVYNQTGANSWNFIGSTSLTVNDTSSPFVSSITPNPIDLASPPAVLTIAGGGFVNAGFGWSVVNFTRSGQLLAQARASSGTGTSLSVPFPGTTNIFGGVVPGLSAGPVTLQVYNQTGANSWNFIGTASLTVNDTRSAPSVSSITPNPTDLASPPASFTITGGGFVNAGFGFSVVNFTRNGQLLAQARASSGTGTTLSVPFPSGTNILGGALPGLSSGPVTVQVYNQTGANGWSFIGSTSLTVNDSRSNVLYTSFNNETFSLYPWYGEKIVLLTRNTTLDPIAIEGIVGSLDAAYTEYQTITGHEPTAQGTTSLNGRDIIAELPDGHSCGAACGYLGVTGIEIESTQFGLLYNGYLQHGEYGQALFYELGHNFWFYDSQLGALAPFAAGFAVANRFISMELAGLNGGLFNASLDFQTAKNSILFDLLNSYQADSSLNWQNTLAIGAAPANTYGWTASDLAGAILYRLFYENGIVAYQAFYETLASLPQAISDADAVNNFIQAAHTATGQDYSYLFCKSTCPAGVAQ